MMMNQDAGLCRAFRLPNPPSWRKYGWRPELVDEDTETFTVSLREPLYARLTGGEQIATGTIDDNDPVTKSGAPM